MEQNSLSKNKFTKLSFQELISITCHYIVVCSFIEPCPSDEHNELFVQTVHNFSMSWKFILQMAG